MTELPQSQPEVSEQAVQEQLERLLASSALKGSTRGRELLRHCVRKVLEGNASDLTEAKLIQELMASVPGKPALVLQEAAARLRQRLNDHYAKQGRRDPVYIGLPVKSFIPEIRLRTETEIAQAARKAMPRRLVLQAMIVTLLAISATVAIGIKYFDAVEEFLAGRSIPDYGTLTTSKLPPDLNLQPAISADGQTVVYASDYGTKGNLAVFVQSTRGTKPVRLTEGDFNTWQPDISQDGNRVAYRSEADGAAYVVDLRNPKHIRVAEQARDPRFSRDGKWIAFWRRVDDRESQTSIYVVEATGGTPRRLRADFQIAKSPVWAPDGQHLLFVGQKDAATPADWYVSALDDSPAVATGALHYPPKVAGMTHGLPRWWRAQGNLILFEAVLDRVRSAWHVKIDKTFQITDEPKRIVQGKLDQAQPSISISGHLVMNEFAMRLRAWRVPLKANEGEAIGDPVAVSPEESGPVYSPAGGSTGFAFVGTNANVPMVLFSKGGANPTPVSSDARTWSPLFTRSGLHWLRLAQGKAVIDSKPSQSAVATVPCDQCEALLGAAPDGKRILATIRSERSPAAALAMVRLDTGERELIPTVVNVTAADWSPDGKWIAVASRDGVAGQRVLLIAASNGAASDAMIAPNATEADQPRWSPNGELLYYLGNCGAFRCLYARRIDRSKGVPTGESQPVYHFHKARLRMRGIPSGIQNLTITDDSAVLCAEEARGIIHSLAPKR